MLEKKTRFSRLIDRLHSVRLHWLRSLFHLHQRISLVIPLAISDRFPDGPRPHATGRIAMATILAKVARKFYPREPVSVKPESCPHKTVSA